MVLTLHLMQFLVVSIAGEEFFVGAALNDLSLVENADFVAVLDSREAVGDGYCGARLHQSLQRILHKSLALGVECRCCFVENENRRVL